jgi:hypothetical protein
MLQAWTKSQVHLTSYVEVEVADDVLGFDVVLAIPFEFSVDGSEYEYSQYADDLVVQYPKLADAKLAQQVHQACVKHIDGLKLVDRLVREKIADELHEAAYYA